MVTNGILVTKTVNFHPKENAVFHHTAAFEELHPASGEPTSTIVRRGKPFTAELTFDRPYNHEQDVVLLRFKLGNKSQTGMVETILVDNTVVPEKSKWSVEIKEIDGNNLSFSVTTSVKAPVGYYQLQVITKIKNSTTEKVHDFEKDFRFYVLFNPWNKDDQTFMPDTSLLEEYVLNSNGLVCNNIIENSPQCSLWDYNQFDKEVLPDVMYLFDKTNVPYEDRGDVVKMVRHISAAINFEDEDGVLVGRWNGHYEDGVSPDSWNGSLDIFKKYIKDKTPVRYGQCWVFAGLVTTVCRALGIPCRVVSNISSGVDGDGSLTIDLDSSESIWSYHVWNDVWMARPDLPLGYGGWQAIDATPMIKSSGKYQCGPASLEAIKHGLTTLDYDVGFLLAEVDADVVSTIKDSNPENGSSVSKEKSRVGKYIITKKPLVQEVEQIDLQYKYLEGTNAERLVYETSIQNVKRLREKNIHDDVTFELQNTGAQQTGEDVSVVVRIKNNSSESRLFNLLISATGVYYNGIKGELIQEKYLEFKIEAGKEIPIKINIPVGKYLPKLVEQNIIKVSVLARVVETKQPWFQEECIHILKPKVTEKRDSLTPEAIS